MKIIDLLPLSCNSSQIMKKPYSIAILISLLLLITFQAAAQRKKNEKPDTGIVVVDINAALTIDMKETNDYSFCLHRNGATVDSQFVSKAQTVTTELHRNDIYTLSFHKEGYPDKYVVIDMHVPKKKAKSDYYEIAFEIELHPQHGLHKEEYKDHPVAIFKYDKNENEWNFSTKYHEEIHEKVKSHRK
jgi:hypothetical protein